MMIKIAAKPLSAAQAATYYAEFAVGDYYATENVIPAYWSGSLAAELGMAGAVDLAQFRSLLDGRSPAGAALVPKPPKGARRAAWDFGASVDKSISVAALVGGDQQIIADVVAANAVGMHEVEKFARGKDTQRTFETTANLAIASFVHDTSRQLDPQLHVHNVVLNMTRRRDGKVVALETGEMYRAQRYFSAVFRAELARRLQTRYALEIGRDGSVRIAGIPAAVCEQLSKRRNEILQYVRTHKPVLRDAAQEAAFATRASKRHVERAALVAAWQEATTGIDFGALRREPAAPPAAAIRADAAASLCHAREHLAERDATFRASDLMREALIHGIGKVTLADVEQAVVADPEIIRHDAAITGVLTTRENLRLEERVVALMRQGHDTGHPITTAYMPSKALSDGQAAVVAHVLASHHSVIAIEGKAGAGKTYTLSELVDVAQAAGYQVRGYAPTTSAATTLSECGIHAKTVAALGAERDPPSGGRQLWVVDEAGLLSTRDACTVLERAHAVGAKVLLVGDTRQHAAVAAGSPFAYLQANGLQSVRLDEIQRQARPAAHIHAAAAAASSGRWRDAAGALAGSRVPECAEALAEIRRGHLLEARAILERRSDQARALQHAVQFASDGAAPKAAERLDRGGAVLEVADRTERHRAAAAAYLATPAHSCLVVAPSNAERRELNEMIRAGLIAQGRVAADSRSVEVRVSRALTNAQKRDVRHVEVGDAVRFGRASRIYAVKAGSIGRVVATDPKQNRLQVEIGDRIVGIDPRRYRPEVFAVERRSLAVGDRIQFREALRTSAGRIANGDMATVSGFADGHALVQLPQGPTAKIDLAKLPAIDHAYAVTSHASQGKTVDRVIAVVDTAHPAALVNARQFYVSISRASLEARVITSSRAELAAVVSREPVRSSALAEFGKQKQTQKERHHGNGLRSGSEGQHRGSREHAGRGQHGAGRPAHAAAQPQRALAATRRTRLVRAARAVGRAARRIASRLRVRATRLPSILRLAALSGAERTNRANRTPPRAPIRHNMAPDSVRARRPAAAVRGAEPPPLAVRQVQAELAQAEQRLAGTADWRAGQNIEAHVEALRERLYEAQQDARRDIPQDRIAALRDEREQLDRRIEHAGSYAARTPLEERRHEITDQIYALRHGPRSDLGDLSGKLGRDEHRLHAAHHALAATSPATAGGLRAMTPTEARHFTALMERAVEAKRRGDRAAEHDAIAEARRVDRDRGPQLSR